MSTATKILGGCVALPALLVASSSCIPKPILEKPAASRPISAMIRRSTLSVWT